jgi:thymidine kinase
VSREADFDVKSLDAISSVDLEGVDVVAVDEGQFFPDLASFCSAQASSGRIVVVAALDGTYDRKPWPSVSELIPLSESVIKLTAICHSCGAEAPFSRRIVASLATTLIGDKDKYEAACRRCYESPRGLAPVSAPAAPTDTPTTAETVIVAREVEHKARSAKEGAVAAVAET